VAEAQAQCRLRLRQFCAVRIPALLVGV
jgi:hypothetical protein